ncbi:MAG: hypothetical protein FWE33_07505 [Defluviitaleaceae bacterium]|nr:hypothetical protein [Defluviitaleaceae bacterium]
MVKKMIKLLIMFGLIVALTSCGDESSEFELPKLFFAQTYDEIIEISLSEATSEADERHIQEYHDRIMPLLTMSGRPMQDYLEDFDFIVNLAIDGFQDNKAAHWDLIRDGIENFFHMNDFIFHFLILYAADSANILHTVDDLPFLLLPYELFVENNGFGFVDYVVTPNNILVVIYDF